MTTTLSPNVTRRVPSLSAVPNRVAALVNLQTFGCQMNEYDSELVRTILHGSGCSFTEDEAAADVILFNTCAIRETAHNRIYARLDALKEEKKERRDLVVGVLGCMSQNLKEGLLLRFPAVDLICGPDAYRQLPDLIARSRGLRERGTAIELSEYETYEDIAPTRVEGVNAWIAIMRGCDNFCTFCVVPYTRGRERSRDPRGIVEETCRLADQGYKQVTLLGQNANSYRCDGTDFADLMRQVAAVPGIARVRFTSPHPKDFPAKLLGAIASEDHLCKHIHLPLQAGSDRVLKKMNRDYTQDEFLRLVDQIRATIPNVALSTDIICGFPTESDDEFAETEKVMRGVEFDSAFMFKYSQRVGTIAAKLWDDDVPDLVKSQRVTHLVDLQRQISLRHHLTMVGGTVTVLIEGESRKSSAEWRARTDGNTIVVFADSSRTIGDICDVRIMEASANTLRGIPLT
ncbi:MAG: tRNA (N6-isopentenyl adenosine(37)-C2)-methylthiotransferase MiaB [candidate division Zixibacteria bacterium]|nr:tRNA (N6-isopentenyl adenosine(37)-C2)-methylthiotransferase MiaB [candidate division Zixibacteria bacterium]